MWVLFEVCDCLAMSRLGSGVSLKNPKLSLCGQQTPDSTLYSPQKHAALGRLTKRELTRLNPHFLHQYSQ